MIGPDDFKKAIQDAYDERVRAQGKFTASDAWMAIEPLLKYEMPKVVQAAYDSGRSHAMEHLVANDGMGL